ncbi:unnamed protein product [Brassica rapa subsp. narinosa]
MQIKSLLLHGDIGWLSMPLMSRTLAFTEVLTQIYCM